MRIFYWAMGLLIVGTLVPSIFSILLYGITGDNAWGRRASRLWGFTRMFGLLSFNILVWGHVIVGLWHVWRG